MLEHLTVKLWPTSFVVSCPFFLLLLIIRKDQICPFSKAALAVRTGTDFAFILVCECERRR
jgi:hypothetical protein